MDSNQMTNLGKFFQVPGYSSEVIHLFLAKDLFHAPLKPDADEFLNVRPIKVDAVYKMVKNGEIQDGKTLAALLKAQDLLLG
jgi:ADP-ribose pyrophosphatase